jgi:hypothetical protein
MTTPFRSRIQRSISRSFAGFGSQWAEGTGESRPFAGSGNGGDLGLYREAASRELCEGGGASDDPPGDKRPGVQILS